MKNYAMPLAIAIVGFGLMSIGFNLNGNQAVATPAAFNTGPEEPAIVWYGVAPGINVSGRGYPIILRAWTDGTIEARRFGYRDSSCNDVLECPNSAWFVISSPNEGLNAAADINFDEIVDGSDLAQVLAAWGDAPRNDYPPSDCPLGLIP